jgi:hypothetical protein
MSCRGAHREQGGEYLVLPLRRDVIAEVERCENMVGK